MKLSKLIQQEDVPSVGNVRVEWEHLGATDPLWAVLNDPTKSHGNWNEQEFFASGSREVNTVFSWLDEQGVKPRNDGSAIDFGCGVGRLTRPLAERFSHVVGVDCSESMINHAKSSFNCKNLEFLLNSSDDLAVFPAASFDFALTLIVLQHIPPPGAVSYLADLLRLLRSEGILVFQVPTDYIEPRKGLLARVVTGWQSFRASIALRTRIRRLLESKKHEGQVGRVVRMFCIPEQQLANLVAGSDAEIIASAYTNSCHADYNGKLAITAEPPISGYVSRLFVVKKH